MAEPTAPAAGVSPENTREVVLPDGRKAYFPSNWTPGMIQSKLWDQFPQWRPKGPVTAFQEDPLQQTVDSRQFPSYDAYLTERTHGERLAAAAPPAYDTEQPTAAGPHAPPPGFPELPAETETPRMQPGEPLISELRPMIEDVAREWGVQLVTADDLRKANPTSTMDLKAMAQSANKAIIEKVRNEALARIKSGKVGATLRGVQEGGVGLGHALTEPLTVGAVGVSMAVPPLAAPIWAGFTAHAGSQLAGSVAGGAPAQQIAAEGTGLGLMLLPGATKGGRAGLAKGFGETISAGKGIAERLAPMTTRAAAATPAAAPAPAVTVAPQPAATPLANLATGLIALENARASVAESGQVPYTTVNRALNNMRTQLEAARKAARAAGARAGATGAQPAEAATSALAAGAAAPPAAAEAAFLAAKKAIADANAAVIRSQAGVVDAQQVAAAISVALSAARNYHTALGSTVTAQQQATQAPTPTAPRPTADFTTLTDEQKFELLAQKNAAGAGFYSPEELAFANQIVRDPAQLARFNARRLEIEAHAKAGTAAPPPTQGGPSASSQPTSTEIHGNVQPQPEQGQGQVPVAQGGGGVQPQAQGGIREPPTPEARAKAINELKLEGVTEADAQALLDGTKTVKEVVEGNFKVTPGWTVPPGAQGHAEAWIEGYDQALVRLGEILDRAAPPAAAAPVEAAPTTELTGPAPEGLTGRTPADYVASALESPELTQVKGTPFEGTILDVDPATATRESLLPHGVRGLDLLATLEGVTIKRTTPTGVRATAVSKADAILEHYRRINELRAAVADPSAQNRIAIYDRARAIRMGLLKHRMAVASALEQGQAVPLNVLRHYPDLAKRYSIDVPKPKPFEVPPEQSAEPTKLAPADARNSLISPEEYKATMEALATEYPEKTAPVLSQAEIDHLRDYTRAEAQSGDPLDLRNHALVEIMYASGLRNTEARLIREPRIHRPTAADPHAWLDIAAETAKGSKARKVPITQEALAAVDRYLKLGRPALLEPNTPPGTVFLTKTGAEMAAADVWRTISGLGKESGMPSKVWPHILRHTFASQALARGVPRPVIMEMMGHTRESTTAGYLHPDRPSPTVLSEYGKFSGEGRAQPPGRTPGFFPRRSEAQGLGEPSMPPTVEDVRRQRALEEDQPDDYVPPELLRQGDDQASATFQDYQRTHSYFQQSAYLSELFSDFLENNPKHIDPRGMGFSTKEAADYLADAASIMAKNKGASVNQDIAKAVELAREQNPEIDDVVSGLIRMGEDHGTGVRDFAADKIIEATSIDRQLVDQAMKDPQVWPEIRAEVYQADPGLGKFIDTHVHPSYVPPEAYLSPDRGTQRGDPPEMSVQAAQQAAISGWALHGLPRGVNPGPANMAAQLMAAARRIKVAVQSDVYLRPDVEGRMEYSQEVDRAFVADVKNQRTIAHEIGHSLNPRLFSRETPGGEKIAFGKSQRSLQLRAREAGVLGVTGRQLYSQLAKVSELMRGPLHNAYRRSAPELIADHASLFLHDRNMAAAMAPDWTRVIENQLAKPGNAEILETIQQIHRHDVEPVPGELEPGVSSVTMQAVKTPDKIGIKPALEPAAHDLDIALASRGYVKDSVRMYAAEEARARAYRENAAQRLRNPDERKDVGAFIEGSGNIERQGDDIGSVKARMTKPMKDFAVKFSHDMEFQRQRLNRYLKGVSKDEYLRHLDDYLPHFYVQNEQFGGSLAKFVKDSPSAKARVIPSFAEAVRYGFRPITQDPAALYEIYGRINWRVATNRKLVEQIYKLRDPDGNKVILPASDPAAANWKTLDRAPMFERFVAFRRPGGQTMLWKGDFKAHPSVYAAIRQVIERPISTPARWYDWLNSITRSMAFSLSGFHDVSLSFASVAASARWYNPLRGLVRVGERDPVSGERKILQTAQSAGRHLGMQEDVVADAALHGLRSAWADSSIYEYSSRHAVDATLRFLESKPVFKQFPQAMRLLRKAGEYRQKSLWSWTHDAFKLQAYHDITAKALERAKPGVTATEIKERTASFLNDAFGGQDWQTQFWQSPQTRRIVSRFLLAPDWTLSTIRSVPLVSDVATFARTQVPRLFGRETLPGIYEGKQGNIMRAKFWALEALAVGVTSMAIQWAFYQLFGDDKKGDRPNMLDNEPGESYLGDTRYNVDVTPVMREFEKLGLIHVLRHTPVLKNFVPTQESYEHTRHYMNMGKRFAEILRYVLDPVSNIESKVSRPLAESIKQFSGRDGEFAADWTQDETGPQWPKRLKSIAQNFLPFSMTGNQFMLSQPAKKGMTNYKAQQAFEAIYEIRADPSTFMQVWRAYNMGRPRLTAVTKGDLQSMMAQIYDAANRNGASPEVADSNALTKVRGRHLSAYTRAMVNQNNAALQGDKGRFEEEGKIMVDEMEYLNRIGFTAEGLVDSIKAHVKRSVEPTFTQPTAP